MLPEVEIPVMAIEECRCDVSILKPKVDSHLRGKCTPKSYPYQALSSNNTSIRLLKNLSFTDPTHRCGEDMFKSIKCSLVTCALDDIPSYTALSYTWGDPKIYYAKEAEIHPSEDWYCQCYNIEIDGVEVTVSANLYAALTSIQHIRSMSRYAQHEGLGKELDYLWIDALCVNQSDLVEKSQQVQLMSQIYSQSQSVLVWLGGRDELADTAIPFIHGLADLGGADRDREGKYSKLKLLPEIELDDPRFYEILGIPGHISIRQWGYIISFLNRSWFRRAWVVQVPRFFLYCWQFSTTY